MDGCESTCTIRNSGISQVTPEMIQAAETLACLLTDVPEFQDFVRLSREIHLDEGVNRILAAMNGYDGVEMVEDNMTHLDEQLEALPVMREYRQAETAARKIFSAVENAISEKTGVAFAEHARPSACS